MENNGTGTVTETATLGNFLEGKPVGTPIFSETCRDICYWTGEFANLANVQHAVLVSPKEGVGVRYYPISDTSWWRVSEVHQPATGDVLSLIVIAAKSRAALQVTKNTNMRLSSEIAKYKETVREALIDWFDENLDEDDSGESFDELLENLGLGARVKKYTVTGTVTYSFEFEVDASSEDEAREAVESDFGDFASELDVYYADSIDVDSVDLQ